MNIVHTDTSYISIRSNFEMCLNMLCIIVTKVINQIFVHIENSAKLARLGSGSRLDK